MKQPMRIPFASTLVGIVALAAALAWLPARADEETDHAADLTVATERARRWLDALDAGRHDESWNTAAWVMKQGRSEEDWIKDIGDPRAKLGKPLTRELQRADFSTNVRGAPPGKYVTATYLSQFAQRPPILESVLVTLDNGTWRIAGYSAVAAPSLPAPASPPAKGDAGAGAKPGS